MGRNSAPNYSAPNCEACDGESQHQSDVIAKFEANGRTKCISLGQPCDVKSDYFYSEPNDSSYIESDVAAKPEPVCISDEPAHYLTSEFGFL